jgi:hypothetical protein
MMHRAQKVPYVIFKEFEGKKVRVTVEEMDDD